MVAVVAIGLAVVPGQAVAASPLVTEDCPTDAADAVAAARVAAQCDVRVEVLSERTESTQVFAEPSGAQTLVASTSPERVRRADGSWADLDPSLRRDGDGLVPVASLVDIRFSAGGAGPLVTWRAGRSVFTLSWPESLPTPTVEGGTARYAEVLPGVDLTATATSDGYTHALVVKNSGAATSAALREVRYRVGGDLRLVSSAEGLTLVDAVGNPVASSSPATMWDSSFAPAEAGEVLPGVNIAAAAASPLRSDATRPGPGARSAPIGVALADGDLVVRPDVGMLTRADVVYPLFIDPAMNQQRSKWAYANSGNSNNSDGKMWVGLNPPAYDGYRYRSYFEFNISALAGSTILSAYAQATLYHSWSCSATWMYLFRVGGAIPVAGGARMAFSALPLGSGVGAVWLDSWAGNANKAGGCGYTQPDMTAIFDKADVKLDLQAVANASGSTYTLGMCACDGDVNHGSYEYDQNRWKKFYADPTYLVVTYDKAPNAPVAQAFSTSACYVACVSPAVVRTTQPTLKVNVSDPYNGNLSTTFEVRTAASGTATLVTGNAAAPVVTAAPGTAQWQVPSGKLVNGSTYYWRARSRDEASLVGAWSAWQTLTVDTSTPAMASVSSVKYPAGQWGAVVGTQGTFTFTAGSDVRDFTWSVDSGSLTTVTASGTNPKTASVTHTPATDMVHTLHVRAKDVAGNVGATFDHQFWVSPVANKYSHWALDATSGTVAADSGTGGSTLSPGTLSGTVTWANDPIRLNVASFAGSGQIATAGPVLDTTKAFTVAAWVRFTDLTASGGYQTVVSQAGANTSRFQLEYRADANGGTGGFCMTMRATDVSGATPVTACATQNVWPVIEGEWVHLAGVYSPTLGEIRIYVMGDPAQCGGDTEAVSFSGSWSATGQLVIGRSNTGGGGAAAAWLTGDVDAVYAYQRALAETEVCQLALQ